MLVGFPEFPAGTGLPARRGENRIDSLWEGKSMPFRFYNYERLSRAAARLREERWEPLVPILSLIHI